MRHWFALVILGVAFASPALAVPPALRADGKGDRLDAVAAVVPAAVIPDSNIEFIGPADEAPAVAEPPAVSAIRKDHFADDVCEAISREARRRQLPEEFFARLIWRESLFDPNAVSPKGAEGIAQFMPATAKLRGLADPFVPNQALEASAHFLSDLKTLHGNLGLAAAAYNAGSGAVTAWLQGSRDLPFETQDYVLFVTGHSAEEWAKREADYPHALIGNEPNFVTACVKLVLRQLNPSPPTERATWKPWGVVLARGFVESRVLKSFAQLRGRYPSVLANQKPMVVRKKNLSMGRRKMATAMVGTDNREEAEDICGKLRKLGAVCVISRND